MAARLSDAERDARRKARSAHSFSNAAYKHYDTAAGFGSAAEWMRTAETMAELRFGLLGQTVAADRDLDALGLFALPATARELRSAFNRVMLKAHPDHGGTEAAVTKVLNAYRKLLLNYRST